ncbi:MAG: hypothetical protein ACYC7E_18340 [Armatimonadota bacterium]
MSSQSRVLTSIIIIGLALFGTVLWQLGLFRRVDGRTAADWIALARRAAATVTYHAEGTSVTEGKGTNIAEKVQAGFTLDQGPRGSYLLRTTDASGRRCSLGFDGTHTWYQAGEKSGQAPATDTAALPAQGSARILGLESVASRAAVRVKLRSGQTAKVLSIDRETGVILAMTTIFRKREISSMRIDTITYRKDIVIPRCQMSSPSSLRAGVPAELAKVLGRPALRPAWLPNGYVLQGSYLTYCECCRSQLAVLRYADGVNALTLFQARGMSCNMGSGCKMAPTGSALVETRRIKDISVVAVGTVSAQTLQKVLDNLR